MVDSMLLNLDAAVPGSEPKHRYRGSAIEQELFQLIVANKNLEDSLWRITKSLHRHEPQIQPLVVLANCTKGTSAFGNCTGLDRALETLLNKDDAKESTGTNNWAIPLVSSSDIAHNERWAGRWRDLFKVHGILACHSAPIRDAGKLQIGCVMLCFSQPRQANDSEKHLAQFISSVIAVLVSREQAMRQSRAQMEQLERLAVVGRLSASITHEINNPLETVANLLFLLSREKRLSPNATSYLSSAQSELRRISEITTQTLHFFRKRDVTESCSAADLIRGLLLLHQSRMQQAKISVKFDEEWSRPVFCHAGELRQVFANLLTNAIDAFAGKGGTIWIRIHASTVWKSSTPGVRITIADNGPGMDSDIRAKIYQAFFTTKPVSGTGLGLWVSAGIVDRHGGSIYVRSRKGRGTAFTIALPTVLTPAASEAEIQSISDRTKAA